MLNRLKLHHTKKYQPLPRVGHQNITIGDRIYLWGGWHKLVPKVHTSSDKIKALSVIEVYNLRTGEWGQLPTSGIPPLGIAYHASTSIGDDIYYFGGRCGHSGCHHDTLYRLNTLTMKWKNMSPSTSSNDGPMKKAQCAMVGFHWRNEDYLFIFGGYGLLPSNHQPQSTYIPKRGKPEYGWTNECHIFCIQTGSWIIPQVDGNPPPPCSNFSMIAVSNTQAVMFGGFQAHGVRMNDTYIVEFGKESVFWSKINQPSDVSIQWPNGLCDHSMTFASGIFSGKPSPCVLLVGGENDDGHVVSDCWIFDLPTVSWTKIQLPQTIAGRLYHSVSSFTLGSHCVWLLIFGGVSELEDFKDWQDQQMMSDTAIVELMKQDNDWIVNIVLDNSVTSSQTSDDYSRKLLDRIFQGRKDWIQVMTNIISVMPPDEGQARAIRAEARADAAEQEAVEARKLAEYTQQLVLQAKENVVRERKESIHLYGDLSDAKKRAQLAEIQIKQVQDEKEKAKVEAKEYAEKLSEMKKKLEAIQEKGPNLQLHSSSFSSNVDSWIIKEDQIEIHEKEMTSRTGNIFNGRYQGTKVFVKRLNKIPPLDEYKSVMDKLNLLHHPNLILFIGATVNENPVIVTESSSFKPLNVHLEETPLSHNQILSLADDVSCAVNYLHLFTPYPIVHGCVCGVTVYLDAKENGWKGKLADTCIIPNMSQPLATHVAPEINESSSYSTQSDVYSFGILLIEMCCRKALGNSLYSGSQRDIQLNHISWPEIVSLIKNCISTNPQDRPSMNDILLVVQSLQ